MRLQSTRRVSGKGRYRVKRNSLVPVGGLVPHVFNPKIGGELATQVRHREYLGDVEVTIPTGQTNAGWQLVGPEGGYPLNPGMSETFPWLSQIASRYIQYTINGMIIEYVSTSGAAVGSSNNQSIGSVAVAVQYDSILAPYSTKSEMLNDQSAVTGVPYTNLALGVECAPQLTTLTKQYIRTGAPPLNTDIRMYDLGTAYVAVDGIQCAMSNTPTTVKLGELWVSYDVILMKASLALDAPDETIGNDYSIFRNISTAWSGTDAWQTQRIFPGSVHVVRNDLGVTMNGTGGLILPPIVDPTKSYEIEMFWYTQPDFNGTLEAVSPAVVQAGINYGYNLLWDCGNCVVNSNAPSTPWSNNTSAKNSSALVVSTYVNQSSYMGTLVVTPINVNAPCTFSSTTNLGVVPSGGQGGWGLRVMVVPTNMWSLTT